MQSLRGGHIRLGAPCAYAAICYKINHFALLLDAPTFRSATAVCEPRCRSCTRLAARPAPDGLSPRFRSATRIVAISLIPVIGFLANGLTFSAANARSTRRFDSLRQATAAADASREFKGAVVTIQAAARSFADHPRPGYLQILSDAQHAAACPVRHASGSSASAQDAAASTRSSAPSRGCREIFRSSTRNTSASASTAIPASAPSCGMPPATSSASSASTCRG